MESKLQSDIIKRLHGRGCWVMKTRPGMGTPSGTADIFFCKEGFYGWLEVKSSSRAAFRPGQESFIEKMADWSWAKIVYPENIEEVLAELELML